MTSGAESPVANHTRSLTREAPSRDTSSQAQDPLPAAEREDPSNQHVADVAAQLKRRLGEITKSMRSILAEQVDGLGDQHLLDLLGASIEGNVDTLLHVLQHNIRLHQVEPPSAAYEYARRLAQHDVPVNALVRAYRLGQEHFLQWCFAEIRRRPTDSRTSYLASQYIVCVTFAYIDWISQHVITVYETEREQWLVNRNTVREARIRELIAHRESDYRATEEHIGYSLQQNHIGVIVWDLDAGSVDNRWAQLEHVVGEIGKELGCTGRPLFTPCDRASGWAWLPFGRSAPEMSHAALGGLVRAAEGRFMLALGTTAAGPDGFRETHLQARQAQRVAWVAGRDARRITAYGDSGVQVAALLSEDVDGTRTLVRTTLGSLAIDDSYRARLRETLLTFLATANSFTTAAAQLTMHRNSVRYRVLKAEEERGASIGADRLDVMLALVACRWLGGAVLTEPSHRAGTDEHGALS
ncbi:PucR C-terminal helix-turn-helix domain-containing protein [Haloechinothrix alba]|uniref:PucR C-terminal helix-turn-helix domain-containing protein n=1 Tax=Haloechinothrix alba TaxID=664784 RepID=A0A238ZNR2_9PSEU|nr:helix-turn-helix domain-containing protein [Haloechinothrix alba]SNR84303.1 PucR C-terminal helix-turn-helix domain-containing protein [Haloechinothrix alba]